MSIKQSLPQDAYNQLADVYASIIDTKPHNAYYEKPATLSLIDEVANKTILDAGCGPGVYAQWLLNRGAKVIGIDANEKMISHARKRTSDKAIFYHANLEEPLTFLEENSFDGVLSPLAITYVKNHKKLFSEFSRILRPKGWFVFSTEHPFFSYWYFKIENYFDTQEVSCDWQGFGEPVRMPSYYHSLGTISEALYKCGFVTQRIVEPKPTEEFKINDPVRYQKLMKFPLFICIKAKKIA
jgi:ubiquinone/menaquinone biosynthesis C-methylase UbiE